jgi:hypothetical protein
MLENDDWDAPPSIENGKPPLETDVIPEPILLAMFCTAPESEVRYVPPDARTV